MSTEGDLQRLQMMLQEKDNTIQASYLSYFCHILKRVSNALRISKFNVQSLSLNGVNKDESFKKRTSFPRLIGWSYTMASAEFKLKRSKN